MHLAFKAASAFPFPLADHPLVASGALVLQSKASCMPAHALMPQPGWTVVDGCAAPGNKTTHLAALMGNRGSIIAFEVRGQRLLPGPRCTGAAGANSSYRPIQERRAQMPVPPSPAHPTTQKDARRLERLRHNAQLAGGTIIDARHADFLATDPEAPEYRSVCAALLDPSCSGSGTAFSRMDYLLPSSADRLKGALPGCLR